MMSINRNRRPVRSHTRRKSKPMLLYAAIGIILIFVAASLVAILNKNLSPKRVSPEAADSGQSLSTSEGVSQETSSESSAPTDESSQDETNTEPSSAETLKPAAPTDNSYFSDACFIGDSRTEGLMLYSGLDSTFYATKGLSISTVFTNAFVDQSMTVLQALETRKFSKIYLMFGINEIGWPYPEVFIQKYEELINQIKARQPDAAICVQSILPVTSSRSDRGDAFNNKNIIDHNKMLKDMAQRLSVQYLDLTPAVSDEAGALPEEASSDGIHLSVTYYQKWVEYLKTHPLT